MNNKFYFQYNLKADNHKNGLTNHYIDVKVERMPNTSIIYTTPLVEKIDLRVVKNWNTAMDDMEQIGEKHFKEIIEQEKIEAAKKTLQQFDNPVLDRMSNAVEVGTIIINETGYAAAL
jgi:hypothetical protein